MIKTVIFDIGMVLMSFQWLDYVYARVGKELGDQVTDAMWSHGVWNELDRGEWSQEKLREEFHSYAPELAAEIDDVYANVGDACFRLDYAIPWVKEMKEKGYRVLYLSNYSHYLMDLAPEVLDFLPHMDGGVFSCDVFVCKPDRRIYEIICEKYQLKPEECFFIDDNQDNILAARAFGWHAHRFTDYETDHDGIMKELEELSKE